MGFFDTNNEAANRPFFPQMPHLTSFNLCLLGPLMYGLPSLLSFLTANRTAQNVLTALVTVLLIKHMLTGITSLWSQAPPPSKASGSGLMSTKLETSSKYLQPSIGQTPQLAPSGRTPRKLALVIGNADYKFGRALPCCASDARAVGAALQRLGFQCAVLHDLSKARMEAAIETFAQQVGRGDKVVFYFSGHGAQAADEVVPKIGAARYLEPICNECGRQDKAACVALHSVQQRIAERKPRLAVYVVDACSDFGRQLHLGKGAPSQVRGLSGGAVTQHRVPEGSVVMMASQPGTVAIAGDRYSAYTGALLQYLEKDWELVHIHRAVAGAVAGTQSPIFVDETKCVAQDGSGPSVLKLTD